MMDDSSAVELAGRSAELGALRSAYRGACEGQTRLLLVDGSRTSGLRELTDHWRREHRAGPVLEVDARRAGTLGRLVARALDELSTVRRVRHHARTLLETSAQRAGGAIDMTVAAERRHRLVDAGLELLSELGAKNPVVVVLHGAASLDRTCLELLERVLEAPSANAPPVLFIVASSRPPSAAVRALAESGRARALSLGPLDRDAVRELLGSADAIEAVLRLTGGDPAQIAQLLSGVGSASEAPPIDAAAKQAAIALATLERPLSDAQLHALIGEPPCGHGLRALGARRTAQGWELPATLRAPHLPPPHDADAIVARLVEVLVPTDPDLAARYALDRGDVARALELATPALSALIDRHATIDAADLAVDVLAAAGRAGLPTDASLHARAAELAWAAGAREQAVAHARAALALDASREARVRLGRLLAWTGGEREAIETLTVALGSRAALEERAALGAPAKLAEEHRVEEHRAEEHRAEEHRAEDAPVADVEATLAEACYGLGEFEKARSWALSALSREPATELGLDLMNTLAKVEMARGERAAAAARIDRVVDAAPAAGCMRAACQALNNRAILAMGRGELGAAHLDLRQALTLAGTHGAMLHRAIAHKNLSVVHQLEGRWSDALHHAEQALRRIGGLDVPGLAARLAFNLADLHRSLGDAQRARELCVWAAHQDPNGGRADEGRLVLAEVLRVLGDAEQADEQLRAVETSEAATKTQRLAARIARTTVALQRSDLAEAETLLVARGDALEPRSAARVARQAAELQLAGGNDAVPASRTALELARRTSDPLLVSDAWLVLARALAAAGLASRAQSTLTQLREHERRLSSKVPEHLRDRFEERELVRGMAELSRKLDGARGDTTARSSNHPSGSAVAQTLLVGTSTPMRTLSDRIARIGASDSTVLVHGESGTGKELVAEALHAASRRAGRPLVRVNCAALVDDLLSSELFGHERGAFTGADRRRQGRFELADGGTIFLDEIGDISPRMQASLLRVLQEGTFERVGGSETLTTDVRVVAATHRDLAALVAEGRFREDLYYRLSGITLEVPPLRARPGDLPALGRHLLSRMESELGPRTLTPGAIEHLAAHPWPGNVRELESALRRASLLSSNRLLVADDFELDSTRLSSAPETSAPTDASLGALAYDRVRGGGGSIYELRKRLERELVERALEDTEGNISRAAELLGMKRPRLSKLVNEWGLK